MLLLVCLDALLQILDRATQRLCVLCLLAQSRLPLPKVGDVSVKYFALVEGVGKVVLGVIRLRGSGG